MFDINKAIGFYISYAVITLITIVLGILFIIGCVRITGLTTYHMMYRARVHQTIEDVLRKELVFKKMHDHEGLENGRVG